MKSKAFIIGVVLFGMTATTIPSIYADSDPCANSPYLPSHIAQCRPAVSMTMTNLVNGVQETLTTTKS